jgi:hypothetical protein
MLILIRGLQRVLIEQLVFFCVVHRAIRGVGGSVSADSKKNTGMTGMTGSGASALFTFKRSLAFCNPNFRNSALLLMRCHDGQQ